MKKDFLLFALLTFSLCASSQTIDLSKQPWRLWLDETAEYFNDSLYLPPYNMDVIPCTPPTCGWQNLYNNKNAIDIFIPATVEEYMWGKNGNTHGICGNYCGVSWFTTGVSVPADWKGKRITIDFESVRMRAEVYLNDKLVGYELINGTPFSIDVTDDVKIGSRNRLAVRITDPNGNFAWRDWDSFIWGKYEIPPSHGFGGITGKVSLHATSHSYIDDIFVKNTPDLNRVSVMTTLENEGDLCNGVIEYSIKEYGTDKLVWKGKTVLPSWSKKICVEKI